MAEPTGLYIAQSDGVFWSGRHRFGGALTNPVDNFILGTTRPRTIAPSGAKYAGLPYGWAPKQTFTAQQYISSNSVIEDVQFDCKVEIRGTNITFRRCRFRGPVDMTNRPVIYAVDPSCISTAGPQNYMEFCEIAPQNITNTNDCMMGSNFHLYRCEMFNGVDTFGSYINPAYGNDLNLLIEGCYLHDQAYFCPDTGGQKNGYTHNDGDQHHSGSGYTARGNDMSGFFAPNVGVGGNDPGVSHYDSTLKITVWDSGNFNSPGVANGPRNINACWEINKATGGTADDLHYLDNWIEGGVSVWNFLDTKLPGTPVNVEIRGNRIAIPKGNKNAILNCIDSSTILVTASGNTLTDGTPLSLSVGDGRYNANG